MQFLRSLWIGITCCSATVRVFLWTKQNPQAPITADATGRVRQIRAFGELRDQGTPWDGHSFLFRAVGHGELATRLKSRVAGHRNRRPGRTQAKSTRPRAAILSACAQLQLRYRNIGEIVHNFQAKR